MISNLDIIQYIHDSQKALSAKQIKVFYGGNYPLIYLLKSGKIKAVNTKTGILYYLHDYQLPKDEITREITIKKKVFYIIKRPLIDYSLRWEEYRARLIISPQDIGTFEALSTKGIRLLNNKDRRPKQKNRAIYKKISEGAQERALQYKNHRYKTDSLFRETVKARNRAYYFERKSSTNLLLE